MIASKGKTATGNFSGKRPPFPNVNFLRMRRLLIGLLTLAWAAAAQAQGVDLGDLKVKKPIFHWGPDGLTEPRRYGYGGRQPDFNLLAESRKHHMDKVFERVELKIRDDRLHAEMIRARSRLDAQGRLDRKMQKPDARRLQVHVEGGSGLLVPVTVSGWNRSDVMRERISRISKEQARLKEEESRMVADYWRDAGASEATAE